MRSTKQKTIFIICGVVLLSLAGCQAGSNTFNSDQTEYSDTAPITETFENIVSDTYPEETAKSDSQPNTQASANTSAKKTTIYSISTSTENETTARQINEETKDTTQKVIEKTSKTTVQTTSTLQSTHSPATTKSTTAVTTVMTTTAVTTEVTTAATTTAMSTPTPTTAPLPTWPERDVPRLRQEMFNATNEVRKSHGALPLAQGCAELQKIAMIRAEELATQYSHKRPDGTYYDDMLDTYGITHGCAGENIAKFSELGTVDSVISAWSNSTGHLNNIIYPDYDALAIGYYQCQYGRQYWVQIFIGEKGWVFD